MRSTGSSATAVLAVVDLDRPSPMLGEPGRNTCIATVATNAALTQAQAKRMAVAAHDGLGRAIVPAHTPLDGDLVFSVSTGERPLGDAVTDQLRIGHAAAFALSRAVMGAIYHATPRAG